MAYRNFFDRAGLKIEVEDDGGTTSSAYAPALTELIGQIAAAVTDQLAAAPDGGPSEVEIGCALEALPAGGFAIARGEETANLSVRMLWSTPPGGGVADQLAAPGSGGA